MKSLNEKIETSNSEIEKLKVKAILQIELGNAESRFAVIHENKTISYTISKRSEFAELPQKYNIPDEYLNENSTILKYVDKDSKETRLIANGMIVKREFADTSIRPTSLHTKSSQEVTIWILRLAFKEAIIYLADYYKKKPEHIDFTFDVGVLLSPVEEAASLDICEKIKEISYIETIAPYVLKKELKIDKVFTSLESVVSFKGCYV
ncbi:hypothetical protein Q3304_08410 [Clostridioides sp. GD02377]|uniref:hypothetical protein n=1 Tax=unclassified Clostridioides TaxID=2635829 RepID=UPI0038AC8D05